MNAPARLRRPDVSPADLYRLVKDADSPEILDDLGLTVWKVGDTIPVGGVAVTLDHLVVVQESTDAKHGRVVMFGHDAANQHARITGSFPILFVGNIRTEG